MKKWNMVIDIARCHDCNNCFLADKDEFVGNAWPPYSEPQPWEGHRWVNIERRERGGFPHVEVAYLPLMCQHCDDAPCIRDSPAGTIYKRDDGLVIIDPEKARGRREIVETCPYGVIYWNEEVNVAQKCTGCAHLMDEGWKDTRCSQVCPTEALTFVLADDDEMAAKVAAESLVVYHPEWRTAPRVYYRNLHKWDKAFLAGSVVFGDTGECAEGAAVTIMRDGATVGEGVTNNYGDFRIDKLEPGEYSVSISAPGYREVDLTATVGMSSTSLAALELPPL
jgi:Fe-S-cluster-containing dehydrogenase component